MKELKTYAHLYLGCDVKKQFDDGPEVVGKLVGVTTSEIEPWETIAIVNLGQDIPFQEFYVEEVKLVLRPLSDMTEEEEKEMRATQDDVRLEGYPKILLKTDSGETFIYMLSKGFDIFGLIDAGLAVSKTETTKP